MRFDTFTSRFDDAVIQELLGTSILELITLIDRDLLNRSKLIDLVVQLYTPAGLLLDSHSRSLLLELLDVRDAERLALVLGLNVTDSDVYGALKRMRIRRGSEREQALFDFFALPRPKIETVQAVPSTQPAPAQYPMFEHQREAARKITAYLQSKHKRVVLHMPTGSGKTRTTMNIICEHLRQKEPTLVVWLAHSQELCEQAAEEFTKAWASLGNRELKVYLYWGDHDIDVTAIEDGFVVAGLSKAYQTATRQIQFITELGRRCSLVIMDEAHSAVAETYSILLDALVIQRRETGLLGLTATPGRTWLDIDEDEKLARFFHRQKVSLSIEGYDNPVDYLVDEGYLAEANFQPLRYDSGDQLSDADLEKIESSLEIPSYILEKLADDEQRNLRIYVEIERLAKTHNRIIVFATTVKHSDLLAAILQIRGYDARSITSKASSIERTTAISRYKAHAPDVRILCNYGVLTTGFDAPQTSAAVIARPTKSLVLYSQMVGRAIRGIKAGGNETAEIITIVDTQLPGFGSVAEAFTHWEDVWE